LSGSRLLRIASLFMIIFGAGIMFIMLTASPLYTMAPPLVIVATLLNLCASAMAVWAGIQGSRHWDNPIRAGACIVYSLLIIVLFSASGLLHWLAGQPITLTPALGMIVPGAYLVGALQLKSYN
jgi:hypothetical protein